MPLKTIRQLPFCITSIQQGLRLYPANHPQLQKLLERSLATLKQLHSEHQKLTIGLIDGTLLLNDIPCLEQLPALHELVAQLDRQQLQTVEISPGVDPRQLLIFCQELPQLIGGELAERLETAGVTAIHVDSRQAQPEGAAAVYQAAVGVAEKICSDVRMGRIPASRQAVKTTKNMVKTILKEPFALLAMAMLKDYDNYTFQHSVNVAVIAMSVGRACGVSDQELYELGLGGLLHDLGKMTVDHRITAKPGRLSAGEFALMQLHPVNGAKIVAGMQQIPPAVIDIVNHHHLGYDHSGYPEDARGHRVSQLAAMTSIADAFDAMTSIRCYQRPMSPKQALAEMKKLSGSYLHPIYLEKFLSYLGSYPVGTLVRLKNGSIGLICDQNQHQPGSLTVKIIFDTAGSKIAEPLLIELPDSKKIVAEVNPALKGLNLNDYLP